MLSIPTSKDTAICYLEKGDADGGALVVYLKILPTGVYAAQREWFSDPTQAMVEFATIDTAKAEEKLALIDTKLGASIETIKV